jgi:glycosyltransferase involved in cell wall biosynthesis
VPYAEADVLLFPSTWEENSPFVLREAGAAGLRILASDVPGAREVAPQAAFVVDWAAALGAEVKRGQARAPPREFPTLAAHASHLLQRYAALLDAPAGGNRRVVGGVS